MRGVDTQYGAAREADLRSARAWAGHSSFAVLIATRSMMLSIATDRENIGVDQGAMPIEAARGE